MIELETTAEERKSWFGEGKESKRMSMRDVRRLLSDFERQSAALAARDAELAEAKIQVEHMRAEQEHAMDRCNRAEARADRLAEALRKIGHESAMSTKDDIVTFARAALKGEPG